VWSFDPTKVGGDGEKGLNRRVLRSVQAPLFMQNDGFLDYLSEPKRRCPTR